MRLKPIIFLSLFYFLFNSCEKYNVSYLKSHKSYWAETEFEYFFYPNQEFVFKTEGHFGNTESRGKYAIVDSVILLHPYTDWNLHHGVLKNKLIIRKDIKCLRDLQNNFYCTNFKDYNYITEREYILKDSIENRLFQLKEVKKITDQYPSFSKFKRGHPRFYYSGLVMIKNKQYHWFHLEEENKSEDSLLPQYRRVQYKNYLINLNNNTIYKHHFYKDSISVVGELFSEQ